MKQRLHLHISLQKSSSDGKNIMVNTKSLKIVPADATIWKSWWLGEVIGKSETGGIWKKHEQKLDINILEFLGAKLGLFSSSKMIETLSTLSSRWIINTQQ